MEEKYHEIEAIDKFIGNLKNIQWDLKVFGGVGFKMPKVETRIGAIKKAYKNLDALILGLSALKEDIRRSVSEIEKSQRS